MQHIFVVQAAVRAIRHEIEINEGRTVAILRAILAMAPPLNYALALTGVSLRDYVIGSAIGLAPIILILAIFSEQALQFFLP